jgi:hypothetical protein
VLAVTIHAITTGTSNITNNFLRDMIFSFFYRLYESPNGVFMHGNEPPNAPHHLPLRGWQRARANP